MHKIQSWLLSWCRHRNRNKLHHHPTKRVHNQKEVEKFIQSYRTHMDKLRKIHEEAARRQDK